MAAKAKGSVRSLKAINQGFFLFFMRAKIRKWFHTSVIELFVEFNLVRLDKFIKQLLLIGFNSYGLFLRRIAA